MASITATAMAMVFLVSLFMAVHFSARPLHQHSAAYLPLR